MLVRRRLRPLVALILVAVALSPPAAAAAGWGSFGAIVATSTAPGAPTGLSAVRGSQFIELSFTPPASDGGDPIMGYEVSVDDGASWYGVATASGAGATLTAIVGGLSNGTTYAIRLRAANHYGRGPEATAPAAKPADVPSAPLGLNLTPSGGRIKLEFAPPADDGGEPILGYELTLDGGGSFASIAPTPVAGGTFAYVATGLTDGSTYNVGVRARNVVGEGFSGKGQSVTPAVSVPDTPSAFSVASADGAAVLSFQPEYDGGSPLQYYEASTDGGSTWSTVTTDAAGGGPRTARIGGLVNRSTYSVLLRAHNAIGDSAPTQAVAVTPYVAASPAVPAVTASPSAVTATWPVPNPSADITGYTAYASPGPSSCTTTSVTDTSCVLGASAGTTYTVTVVAHGANGVDSPASPASAPVTPELPATPPAPPASAPTTLTTDRGQIALAVPDQEITVIGTGFAPYSTAKVIIYSTPQELGTVLTDAHGDFSVPVRVPAGLGAGTHTFLAAGVDPSGGPRAMALPVTVPPTSVDSTGGGDGNQARLPVPAGGSITLLDADRNPATSVVVPGQGTYVLDAATGTIAFIPVRRFSGRATAVAYRLTDSVGTSVTGTYSALVTAAADGDDTAAPPPPPGAGRPGVERAGRIVARGSVVPVGCTLAHATLEHCDVALYATLSGRHVLVGRGSGAGRVRVGLNAVGRGLVATAGGRVLTARATLRQAGLAAALPARRRLTVVAERFTLPRLVMFRSGSAAVAASDRAYLAAVGRRLKGARLVTCVGHTDARGSGNAALGRRRAAAACRVLTRGLAVRRRIVTRAARVPRTTNRTPEGRAGNRRASVTLAY